MQKKSRVWELDALRGFCILCMILIHLLFDLVYFIGLDILFSSAYLFVQQYGGTIFVILSGVCATLGSKSFRRGLLVFACGMLITGVTFAMWKLGMAGRDVVVRFGVLHLLGICMMLYPLFKKLPTPALVMIGVILAVAGYLAAGMLVEIPWLFPFGLVTADFTSGDFFPLLPHLGWFLLGVCLGRRVYADKQTRFPGKIGSSPVSRFFCFCGRHSLLIYLVHQPLVYGLLELIAMLKQ